MALLEIRNVTRRFGDFVAVDDVSFAVDAGEFFTLLGPSGCGKTTLLRMIAGFDLPDDGAIVLDGVDLKDTPPEKRPIHTVFQSYALFPHMTVAQNIAFPLKMAGRSESEIRAKVQESLEQVKLAEKAGQFPHELSGGQKQRVALARGLVNRPRLLLLDEPLGALDAKLREQMQFELIRLQREVGVTFVFVTHAQSEALALSHRIAVMNKGRIEQMDEPARIYGNPRNRFVADFIGNVNLLDGLVEVDEPDHVIIGCADCKHFVGHGISGNEGMRVTVALRPEKIHLSRKQPEDSYNNVRGIIKELSYFGSFSVYHLELASGARLKVSQANLQRHRDDEFTWGDQVWAHWSRMAHVVLTQ